MDIPIQGVHALLPVTPRNTGNTQVFTIPRQYQEHRLLLVVLEEHIENTPTAHPVAQADTKHTQTTTSSTPPAKPLQPTPSTEQTNNNPKPPENNTQTPPRSTQRQEPTEETHPYQALCQQRFRTPQGLKTHDMDGCPNCTEAALSSKKS